MRQTVSAALVLCGLWCGAFAHAGEFIFQEGESGVVSKHETPAAAPSTSTSGQALRETKPWEIRLQDVNLANTMHRWAADAGWRVRWDARKNVMVEAPDLITGSFEDAVKGVLEAPGIANSGYPLEVCFYPNTPPLARITRKGEQEKECK